MAIKIEPAKMEGYDESYDHLFTVECFDQSSAIVSMNQCVHTVESWVEIANAIKESIERLELK